MVLSLRVVSLFFLRSGWSQHSGSPGQAEFCLLVVSTALLVPGLCGGIFLFSWGQCRGNEYSVSTNCLLSANLEYSSITEYMVYYYCEHQILFKGNQYFSSFLVLLVWFSPLWNFFFSTYFMLSHCMQNSWIVLEPCSVEHRISGQRQLLHVAL